LRVSFGVHPGGRFGYYLEGTWVAPASGRWLLRLEINCDVPFFSDVQAAGCEIDEATNSYGCRKIDASSDAGFYLISRGLSTDNQHCAIPADSALQLTVTRDAYYDEGFSGGRRRTQSGGDELHHTIDAHAAAELIPGTAQRTDTITVERSQAEAQAATAWQATPKSQRTLIAPPTLDEMLVSNTDANALLASLFTVEQQPHVVYPLTFSLEAGGSGSGHRRMQQQGDFLHVTIDTHAPSPEAAGSALQKLVSRLPGAQAVQGRRRAQTGGDNLHYTVDTHICGLASTDVGCTALGETTQQTELVLTRLDIEAIVRDSDAHRRLQMGGDNVHHTVDTHAPTLDEMMVSGSEANRRLAQAFVDAQQPVAIGPTDFSNGHRRLQQEGDDLVVTVETHAATAGDADAGVRRLVAKVGGTIGAGPPSSTGSPGSGGALGTCDLTPRSVAVNQECCDEPEEDCSSGMPAACNAGCAAVVLPFFEDCADALGRAVSAFDHVVALCEASSGAGEGKG
jgi:hypothetical protein